MVGHSSIQPPPEAAPASFNEHMEFDDGRVPARL
jgi:hypothetical protein